MAVHRIEYDEHKAETLIRLEALKTFIREFRAMMVKDRAAEKAKLDVAFKAITPHEPFQDDAEGTVEQKTEQWVQDIAFGHYIRFAIKYYGDLPRAFNYGCIIQIYTLLEERGTLLCRDIKKKKPEILFTVDELRGEEDDINCIRLFLERQCDVVLKDWSKITTFRRLRNAIVHANGIAKEKTLELLKKEKGLEVSDKGQVHVSDDYVDDIFETVEGIFTETFDKLKYPNTSRTSHCPEHLAIGINPKTREVIIEDDLDRLLRQS